MAYEAGTAYLSVIPSMRGNANQIADEMAGPMRRAGAQGGQQFGEGMTQGQGRTGFAAAGAKAGGFFVAAFAAVGLGQVISSVQTYLTDAMQSAGDLGETLNKSNVIFRESAAVVEDWADTASTSAGLSKAAALEAAAGFGNMFSQLGFGVEETAKLSTSVVQLAADLGSFNNLPTEDVANRIAAAFRGEYDSLQALIPNINAARVEQQALADTGRTVAKELTAQEKAQAVLNLIYQDGALALGDFANTADSAANSQKILQAELDNVKTEIGEALLPIFKDLMRVFIDEGVPILKDLAAWFTENQEEIKSFTLRAVDMGLLVGQAFLTMIRISAQWQGAMLAVTTHVVTFWLNMAEGILNASARAFGWIPGVGDRLRSAQSEFRAFRETTERQLAAAKMGSDAFVSSIRSGERAVGDLRSRVQSIDGYTANVRVNFNYNKAELQALGKLAPGTIQARQHGGPVVAGRTYLVGERGPELIVPKTSGTVVSNKDLVGGSGSALGGPIELGPRTIQALGAVMKDGASYTVRDYDRGQQLAGRAAW